MAFTFHQIFTYLNILKSPLRTRKGILNTLATWRNQNFFLFYLSYGLFPGIIIPVRLHLGHAFAHFPVGRMFLYECSSKKRDNPIHITTEVYSFHSTMKVLYLIWDAGSTEHSVHFESIRETFHNLQRLR
jgi:hypothetical protein